jgi:hypothetical protein
MKKNSKQAIYLLAVLGAVLFTAFGCSEDFFDEKAGDRITPDQHYKSSLDAECFVAGCNYLSAGLHAKTHHARWIRIRCHGCYTECKSIFI